MASGVACLVCDTPYSATAKCPRECEIPAGVVAKARDAHAGGASRATAASPKLGWLCDEHCLVGECASPACGVTFPIETGFNAFGSDRRDNDAYKRPGPVARARANVPPGYQEYAWNKEDVRLCGAHTRPPPRPTATSDGAAEDFACPRPKCCATKPKRGGKKHAFKAKVRRKRGRPLPKFPTAKDDVGWAEYNDVTEQALHLSSNDESGAQDGTCTLCTKCRSAVTGKVRRKRGCVAPKTGRKRPNEREENHALRKELSSLKDVCGLAIGSTPHATVLDKNRFAPALAAKRRKRTPTEGAPLPPLPPRW